MNAKQVLLNLAMISTILLSGTRQVLAQEDESWFKERPKAQHQVPTSPALRVEQKRIAATNQRSACDFVTNGDMETQVQPPSRTGNMGPLGGGNPGPRNVPDQLADWYSPTLGSPDYLATNAVNTIAGNDVNPNLEVRLNGTPTVNGSSTPHSGNGEIGLYSRQRYTNANGDTLDRTSEYATVPLFSGSSGSPGLTNGVGYYTEMWVSLSHSALSCNYGISTGFGMWFTPDVNFQNTTSRNYLPQPTSQFIANSSPIGQGAINNGILGSTVWQRVSGILRGNGEKYVTIGAFNSTIDSRPLPGKNANIPNSYVFVDDFQLYKIPTAGPNIISCSGTSLTLGEGCPIPDATYTWTAPGISNLPTNSQNILLTQSPTATTEYTLTVNLPDGSTYSSKSKVTVYGSQPLDPPTATRYYPQYEDCFRVANYLIDNYDPNLSYKVNWVYNATPFPAHPITGTSSSSGTPGSFFVKGGGNSTGNPVSGRFTITVSEPCGNGNSVTSDIIEVEYACGGPTPGYRSANTTTAYPNPASESITIPAGAEGATLVNDKGKVLRRADTSGQLDVQSLPDGLYNLQMMQNGKLINQRIQVKH